MSTLGLGSSFDVIPADGPIDLNTAGMTGSRVHMENYGAVAIAVLLGVGGAGEAPTIDVQEHNAATAGTSQDLDVVTEYFKKEEATLDGDETWTRVTQTAASEVTDVDWDDANEVLVVIQVRAEELSDGFEWVSATISDPGAAAKLGAMLYIPYDLKVKRAPANLPNPNA